MNVSTNPTAPPVSPTVPLPPNAPTTAFAILGALSVCHLLNDLTQSLVPAVYPILARSFRLSFGQIGLITLTFQLTSSVLQPLVGLATDRRSRPFSLAAGMGVTLAGLLLLARAGSFPMILAASGLVGMGSAVFHPESSRMARAASGGRHGLAQSLFQVGGNAGSALGPLLAAFVILPHGQGALAWCSPAALLAMGLLFWIGAWYRARPQAPKPAAGASGGDVSPPRRVGGPIAILLALIISKYFYLTSLTSYYTFYLIQRFGVSVRDAQLHLFVFLGAVALGTFLGGPLGDRVGRKYVIWGSILGVLPFTLLLPWANLLMTGVLSVIIGLILASAFSAILVYAQELLPGRIGLVSGLFFGFAFGMAGIGAALLGHWADSAGIVPVYRACAWLPVLGLLAAWLPDLKKPSPSGASALSLPATGREA